MTKTTNLVALQYLAEGLSAVAARLEPKEAAEAAATLTLAMTKNTDPAALRDLGQALSAILSRDPLDVSRRRFVSVASTIAQLGGPAPILGTPAQLQPALKPPPEPLLAQTLVDLLKDPLCVGEARRVVLGQLARHYGRPFADQWDFVRFAEERQLGLDLLGPPPRLAAPALRKATP
jgi:hypothetical protein